MINGIISKYLIDKITTQKIPTINNNKCINRVQKKYRCELCKSLCKNGAISLEKEVSIDKEKCDNCNVCASVCPTGTLVPTLEVIEKQYNKLSKYEDISISCNEESMVSDWSVQCLAMIPWEFLAYICLENKLYIIGKNCSECKHKELAENLKGNLDRLRIFLGDKTYSKNVIFIKNDKDIPIKEFSRRELFKILGEESKRLFTDIVPIKFEENTNARIYRSLLVNKVKEISKSGKNIKYGWHGLQITEECWGCGMCQRICPQSAISITFDNNGQRKFSHDYTRCTHCGLCKIVCRDDAIENVTTYRNIYEKEEWNISSLTCIECNDPIRASDGELCVSCRLK